MKTYGLLTECFASAARFVTWHDTGCLLSTGLVDTAPILIPQRFRSLVRPFKNLFYFVMRTFLMDIHMHFCQDDYENIIKVHSPKNALIIKFENALKFTLKFTLSLLLHVSIYDRHQGAYKRALLKLYYNSVKVISL